MNDVDKLKEKRKLWIQCFDIEDTHSITYQLIELGWRVSSFRIINEAYRLAQKDKDGDIKINPMLHSLLYDCFFESTLVRIRRLADDKPLESPKGKYDVISLVSVINDIKEHLHLITREHLFQVEEIEYDYSILIKKQNDYNKAQIQTDKNFYFIPQEYDPDPSIERHSIIDILSNKNRDTRAASDTMDSKVFDKLIQGIKDRTEKVKNYVDKRIAHTATKNSQSLKTIAPTSISEIVDILKALANITNFINCAILNRGEVAFLTTIDYTRLKYINEPLIDNEQVEQLIEKQRKDEKEMQEGSIFLGHHSNSIDDFLTKIFP